MQKIQLHTDFDLCSKHIKAQRFNKLADAFYTIIAIILHSQKGSLLLDKLQKIQLHTGFDLCKLIKAQRFNKLTDAYHTIITIVLHSQKGSLLLDKLQKIQLHTLLMFIGIL